MAAFTVEQLNFRVRDDSTALNTDAGWFAVINTDPAAIGTGTANRFRIRLTIDEINNKTGSVLPQLQVDKNSTGFSGVTSTSNDVQATASSQYTDGDACSTELFSGNPPAAGTFSTTKGTADDVDGTVTSVSFAKDEYVEIEYCVFIVDADVNDADTLDFRIADLDASVDPITFTSVPRITVSKGAANAVGKPSIRTHMQAVKHGSFY